MESGLPKIFGTGIFDTSIRTEYRFKCGEILTPLRTVKEYELELFCEDGGISFVNGERNEINKGCILIASPGDKRQSLLHFKALFIHFSATDERLRQLIATLPRFIRGCNFEKYQKLFSVICDPEPDFDDFSDVSSAGRLIHLLYTLRKDRAVSTSDNIPANTSESAVKTSVEYIRKHYSEDLNAEILAKRCHLSTSYFYRIFTQVTDISPNEFITKTRLTAAQSLLASCDMPIVDIAERCGFNSQSYFSYIFKHHFGITPNEFRKNHRYPID